jgi:hypothetical protein
LGGVDTRVVAVVPLFVVVFVALAAALVVPPWPWRGRWAAGTMAAAACGTAWMLNVG